MLFEMDERGDNGVRWFMKGKKRRLIDKASHFTTLIGHNTRFSGRILGADNCIVYGEIKGDCQLDAVLVVGEEGQWQGHIKAPAVIVSGSVDGNLDVGDKLELTKTAHVKGKIVSPMVAIEEGAVHVGEINMGKGPEVVRFKEKRGQNDGSGSRKK